VNGRGPCFARDRLRSLAEIVAFTAVCLPARAEEPLVPEPAPVEVVVRGRSEAQRLRDSAEAVSVVEMARAQRESADLGEVLRRTQGIGLRRSGGLGSRTGFSLNGMSDDQIRFFLDGVPLELTGFVDVSVVPVNLLERVEIYRGVVPVRFGVDALGGAVDLVTDDDYRTTRAGASYQTGSFGTYRGTLQARHCFPETPFVASASAFYDYSKNDYPIDVEVPNALGRLEPARVHRFHDAYRAFGASVEAGLLDLPWARRLLLRVYASDTFKEHQHNEVMTLPYGEVESRESVQGTTLRYEVPLRFVPGLRLETLVAYARRSIEFEDDSYAVYDWFGRRIRATLEPGEVDDAHDSKFVEHRALARLGLRYFLATNHQLRVVGTFNRTSRSGRDALFESTAYLDPATAEQRLQTLISGIEYELDAFDDRLENIAFVKRYDYALKAEQGDDFGRAPRERGFAQFEKSAGLFGAGDGVRLRVFDWLLAKASYEYAVRFPEADAVFGDGRFVRANYALDPERSHNANLGVAVERVRVGPHELRGEINGFLRDTDQLIHALTLGTDFRLHQNIWGARAAGVEGSVGWTSPGNYLSLDANVTWVDQRNTSSDGPFADFEGDRIPNRPWLYGNASARFQLSAIAAERDELSLTWYASYVHDFFRSWESVGRPEYKLEIESQLLHSLALSYVLPAPRSVSTTLEVQNLTDAPAYDYLGVQKAGRAFYLKTTLDFESSPN
jgi:vitamin B12 transporter